MDKVSAELLPLAALVRKLVLEPTKVSQSDADAVFATGWDEAAYHSAVACTARRRAMWRFIRSWRKSEALD